MATTVAVPADAFAPTQVRMPTPAKPSTTNPTADGSKETLSAEAVIVSPALTAPEEGANVEVQWANEATVMADPLIGQQLGDYVVKQRLGQGGMGIVYQGEQPLIGKRVAIKVLRPEIARDPEQVQRLLAEARAVNSIRHRGIIDIFNFGQLPDGRHYVVMEYLAGRALDELIAQRGALPPSEALDLLDEVLAALGAGHEAGIIHRDLKPSNIFLVTQPDGSRYVKLLDFGLAKQSSVPRGATPQTRTDMFVGTPEYVAPEQARAEVVGPYTDLYAAGVVAFEMLAGRLPFHATSAIDWVIQHLEKTPPPPSSFTGGIPTELDELVLRMLQKDPRKRPESAEAIRREIARIKKLLASQATQAVSIPVVPDTPTVTNARTDKALPPVSAPSGRAAAAPSPARAAVTDEQPIVLPKSRAPLYAGLGLLGAVVVIGGIVALSSGTGADEPQPRTGVNDAVATGASGALAGTGSVAISGVAGASGSTGASGVATAIDAGTSGATGPLAASGQIAPTGNPGATGATGNTGATGATGAVTVAASGTDAKSVALASADARPVSTKQQKDRRPPRDEIPSKRDLLREIERLEKKHRSAYPGELPPPAETTLLNGYKSAVQRAENPEDRKALARKLQTFEQRYTTRRGN